MSPQEEIDRHLQPGVIRPQVDVIKLLVHMAVGIDNAAEVIDFIKQPIFRGSDVPKGVIAGIVNFRVSSHILAEIIQVHCALQVTSWP